MTEQAENLTDERRVSQRVFLKTHVNLSSESNFYTGFSNNISEGGLFVATYSEFDIGTVLNLEFSIPDDGPPIEVQAEVRWLKSAQTGSPGIGLRFIDLNNENRQRIDVFCSQRDTIFYDDD